METTQKAKIITVTYQKGGLGKSAVSVNLSAILAWKGYKVLLIDGDRHCTTSHYLGVHDDTKVGFFDVVVGSCTLDQAIRRIDYIPSGENAFKYDPFCLYAIPAYDNIGVDENELRSFPDWQNLLKKALSESRAFSEFDYIIIDCPPESDIFLPIIYNAADFFILPMFPERQPLNNLGITYDKIFSLTKHSTPKKIMGCVVLNYEKNRSAATVISDLRGLSFINCFQTVIPHYKDYDDTLKAQMPMIVFYKEYGLGRPFCFSFISFAEEIINYFEQEGNTNE